MTKAGPQPQTPENNALLAIKVLIKATLGPSNINLAAQVDKLPNMVLFQIGHWLIFALNHKEEYILENLISEIEGYLKNKNYKGWTIYF